MWMLVLSARWPRAFCLCHHDCEYCNKTGDKQLNRRPRSDGLVRKVTVLAVFRLLKRPSGPLIRSGPESHLAPVTSSKSNSCLVSLGAYSNAPPPPRVAPVNLTRDPLAEDGIKGK